MEIVNEDSLLQAKYGNVKLQYNWSQGHMEDLLETFYQLKQNGQISEKAFFTLVDELVAKAAADLADIELEVMREQIVNLITLVEESDANTMWLKYYNESFKLGHSVLLVSHSQGNLFANRVHDTITPSQYKNYFANFQVASPASEVKATKGGYVTLFGDPIINPILGSMGGNANGFPGHAFVEAYLNQSDPYEKIVAGIKQLLPALDSESSQWETDKESNPNTCDYKITVKHRFDATVEMPLEVYPFAPSKKLYQVNGEYVKASCGGQHILDEWEGKKDNECLLIDNPQEEKIISQLEIIGKFYIRYRADYYNQNLSVTGYTNDAFMVLTACDGYGSSGESPESRDIILNFTPEQNRFYFVNYHYHTKALGCELVKLNKRWEDIDVIRKGAVRTDYSNGIDYTYVEYLVDFK